MKKGGFETITNESSCYEFGIKLTQKPAFGEERAFV